MASLKRLALPVCVVELGYYKVPHQISMAFNILFNSAREDVLDIQQDALEHERLNLVSYEYNYTVMALTLFLCRRPCNWHTNSNSSSTHGTIFHQTKPTVNGILVNSLVPIPSYTVKKKNHRPRDHF